MFIFDLKTYNNQKLAYTNAAGLFDVNRIPDRWIRDLSIQEMETKTEFFFVFDKSY